MGKSRQIGRRGEGRGKVTARRAGVDWQGGRELTGKAGVEATGEALSTAKRVRRRGRTGRELGATQAGRRRGDGRDDGEVGAKESGEATARRA